jgi:hypothetical protein
MRLNAQNLTYNPINLHVSALQKNRQGSRANSVIVANFTVFLPAISRSTGR